MKKILLAALFCSNIVLTMEKSQIPAEFYLQRAEKYLNALKTRDATFAYKYQLLKVFIQYRIERADKILRSPAKEAELAQEELALLRSGTKNNTDANNIEAAPYRKFALVYSYMNQAHEKLELRNLLGIRDKVLYRIEKPYYHPLKKISNEEYQSTLAAVSQAMRDKIALECSLSFACALVAKLEVLLKTPPKI